jgi:hypothetical protein
MSHALTRRPVADDRKSDGLRVDAGDKISMTAVGKRGAMLRGIPPPDELLVACEPLSRHDEIDVVRSPLINPQTSTPSAGT